MVRNGWDWNALSAMVSTGWLYSHRWGEIEPYICTFQHQHWVPWSPQTITAAPWLFQCLIVCILNGKAWLRLECIVWNGLHGLAFQSWMGRNWALYLYISTPRLGVLESPNHNCSILTVPMSHCMYIEWWGMVEIGIHCLQWSPWAGFSVMDGEKFSLISVHFNTKIGCLAQRTVT